MPADLPMVWLRVTMTLLVSASSLPAGADTLRVATASSFAPTMQALAAAYARQSGHRVDVVPGATGLLYAQIRGGAPFDAFFAADVERPRRLEQEGRALADTRFTYALGRLVLWSADATLVDEGGEVLSGEGFRHLAIANPELAPYGRAAIEVLERLGLHARLAPRLVWGQNAGQVWQFVASGNAELGFVAAALLWRAEGEPGGSAWWVPACLHAPIEQQAVLLRDSPAARDLLEFMRSGDARVLLHQRGYSTP